MFGSSLASEPSSDEGDLFRANLFAAGATDVTMRR